MQEVTFAIRRELPQMQANRLDFVTSHFTRYARLYQVIEQFRTVAATDQKALAFVKAEREESVDKDGIDRQVIRESPCGALFYPFIFLFPTGDFLQLSCE
jgi:hypothetical protein